MAQYFPHLLLFSLHFYIIHAHFFESSDNNSSPLIFQKGVKEVKKHLSYLGYIDYEIISENISDESLQLALKSYQEFYNLNITGVVDATTISQMQQPRCGIPDFHNTNKRLIPMKSHYSFFPGNPKWRKKILKYAFDKDMKKEEKEPLEEALKEWASSTHFKFIHVSNLSEADIRMSFVPKYHGDGHPFIDPDSGLAHTFAPPDGRVHFDASQNWSSKAEKGKYDIQSVGLHELGHALGLGHSRTKKAAMYPIFKLGERKGLHKDDVKGIKALYKF